MHLNFQMIVGLAVKAKEIVEREVFFRRVCDSNSLLVVIDA